MISPGIFLPPPNPPEVLQEKSVTTSVCVGENSFLASGVKPGLAALRRKMSGNSWGTFMWSWELCAQELLLLPTPIWVYSSPCLNYPRVTLLFLNKLELFFRYLKLMALLEVVTSDTLNAFFSAALMLNSQWNPLMNLTVHWLVCFVCFGSAEQTWTLARGRVWSLKSCKSESPDSFRLSVLLSSR